jgi:hypothetical protein
MRVPQPRSPRLATVVTAVIGLLAVPPAAWATSPWQGTGTGPAAATARTLGSGNTPSTSNVNNPAGNVTLSWSPSMLSNGGGAATQYSVTRYDARTGLVANTTACTSATASCSESSVPTVGTWQYTVTPRIGLWVGSTSPPSGDVNVGAPTPLAGSVTTTNGGTGGKPDQGDTISVQFSQRMAVASLCGTWARDTMNQAITAGNVVTINLVNNGAGTGQDTLTISTTSAACGGAAHFGTFNLGGNYVTANRTCSGAGGAASTVTWTASTSTLTITLGACGTARTVTASTITYTPNAAAKNSTGTAATGTATSTNTRQF